MRVTRVLGAALGTGLLFLTLSSAHAYDHGYERDHWRHEHWKHGNGHGYGRSHHDHWSPERSVVVRERPMIVERERPVFVQPAPMYAPPMQMPMQMPMYNPGPSGVNLNFNIPLR